jgi:4-hydroxy-4-methyl-2-oxoglutarate aldolase
MAFQPEVQPEALQALRGFDTCSISNAIETFQVRLRNTGFADARVRCMFEDLPPMVGYAATARLRSVEPPMRGGYYKDRTEWWNNILQTPAPRIVILGDIDHPPGLGAFLGDVHAAILEALGCVGFVTNGAVRELPALRQQQLQVFAGNVAVSHAYAHIFDFSSPVTVAGLEIHPGDILHGDRHGLLVVPPKLVPQIPTVAERLRQAENHVIDFCRSAEFSVERLQQMLKQGG